MSMSSEYGIISKLYNSRRNILNQLAKQNYETGEYENFNINEINALYLNKQQDMLITNKQGEKIYINYSIDKALRPQQIHDIIEDLYNLEETLTNKDTLMIVSKDSPNETIMKLLVQLYATDNIFITVISLAQLQFNLLEHNLVPTTERLSDEQKKVVKQKYNIDNDSSFPTISRFDPMALIIGLRPNELCKITRPSPTAITGEYYRLCVNKYKYK